MEKEKVSSRSSFPSFGALPPPFRTPKQKLPWARGTLDIKSTRGYLFTLRLSFEEDWLGSREDESAESDGRPNSERSSLTAKKTQSQYKCTVGRLPIRLLLTFWTNEIIREGGRWSFGSSLPLLPSFRVTPNVHLPLNSSSRLLPTR